MISKFIASLLALCAFAVRASDIICLDSSIHYFHKALYVQQKKEVLLLCSYEPSSLKHANGIGDVSVVDLLLIVTDTNFNIKKKLRFGDQYREDVAYDMLVDANGNYIVLSQIRSLYPTEKPIPFPTMLTFISPQYEIISQERYSGYGFAVKEYNCNYYIFGSATESGGGSTPETKVYAAYIGAGKERWRKYISVLNTVFGYRKVMSTKGNQMSYVSTQEAYQVQTSPNDLNAGFNHTLVLVDTMGKVVQSTPLTGISKSTYVDDWYLKGEQLYLVLTEVDGYYTSNLEKQDRHYFVKYNLKTNKISKHLLGEDLQAEDMKYVPQKIFELNNRIMLLYQKDYFMKKSIYSVSIWGENAPVQQDELYGYFQSDLLIINDSKKYLVFAPSNKIGFYTHNLLIKKW